jgi:hypothetical protein
MNLSILSLNSRARIVGEVGCTDTGILTRRIVNKNSRFSGSFILDPDWLMGGILF